MNFPCDLMQSFVRSEQPRLRHRHGTFPKDDRGAAWAGKDLGKASSQPVNGMHLQ